MSESIVGASERMSDSLHPVHSAICSQTSGTRSANFAASAKSGVNCVGSASIAVIPAAHFMKSRLSYPLASSISSMDFSFEEGNSANT